MPSYPNRCQHIKVNGTQCGSPALRRNRFCYFHKLHHEERIQLNTDRQKNDRQKTARARRAVAINLPVLEDADSIQVSLMQITRLLIAGDIDMKTAGLVLYALQTASSNLHRTRFEPNMCDVILDPSSVGETPLGARAWEDSDFLDEDEEDQEPEEDSGRRQGIMKAAEYLYELDRKTGGKSGFASKPNPTPPAKSGAHTRTETTTETSTQTGTKKAPARELSTAEVRQKIRQQIVNAAPALLAANPSFLPANSKASDVPS